MRTGIGYDIHRLTPTLERAAIPIGGVSIPCFFKVQAHSDGDVLLHALTDALLGALALGDIGQRYSDTKPENKGRASSEFVRETLAEVKKLGWRVAQFDSVVTLERPKLAPHADEIRRSIASLLETELANVSLKAKTMEGLGPIGEGRAIAAHAIVTIEPLR
jgi:2-C-methyl-D-erythritol 2,4-cyclodiphosphate synthase